MDYRDGVTLMCRKCGRKIFKLPAPKPLPKGFICKDCTDNPVDARKV